MHFSTVREPGESSGRHESRPCGSKRSSSCPSTPADACSGRWIRRPCGARAITSPTRVREGSLAVDGHARVGFVRSDGGACRARVDGGDDARRDDQRGRAVSGVRVLRAAGAVPRARYFPPDRSAPTPCCSPRSGSSPATMPTRCRDSLIAAVVGDLVRRGVRALEAFGRTAEVSRFVRPADGVAGATPGRGGAGGLLGRPVRARRRPVAGRRLRRGLARIRTSRGCGWSSSRGWAGRPMSRRRWSGCWKPRSCSSRSGRARAPASAVGLSLGLTRPACSTDSSWASSSAKVNVPVGRSFLPSRYSRLTAARMPSAIESRVARTPAVPRSRGLVM